MLTEASPAEEAGQVAEVTPDAVSAASFGELDADMKGFVEGKEWKTPQDAVNSYRNLEKLVRGTPPDRLVSLPEDPKDMGEVWNRLGRPEAVEGYTLSLPEDMKDGIYDQMATKAHEAGLTDAQFQAMQSGYKDVVEAVRTEQGEMVAAELESWKASNQADFNNVRSLMSAVGISEDDMAAAMNGDAKSFYTTLAKVASRMGEGSLVDGDGDGPSFNISPEAAQRKIDQMMGDERFTDRLFHDDPKVREAAAEERRPYMEIVSRAKSAGGPSELEATKAENARLKAELRRRG